MSRYIFSRRQFNGERVGRVDDVHAKFDMGASNPLTKILLVLSYEDVFLNDPRVHRFLPNATKYIGESRRQLRVLLLRDPYNHLASVLKHDATYKSASHLPGSCMPTCGNSTPEHLRTAHHCSTVNPFASISTGGAIAASIARRWRRRSGSRPMANPSMSFRVSAAAARSRE